MKKLTVVFAILSCCVLLQAAVPNWKLPRYSLTAREMDFRQALETFGIAQGIPIIVSPSIPATPVSGVFQDIPSEEFLEKIATVCNMTWYYDGSALYFYGASEVVTTLLNLRYTKAKEITDILQELGIEDKRFTLKTASNGDMLFVSGPPRYVQVVTDIIMKADGLKEQRSFNEIEIRIFPLKHTWADDVTFTGGGVEGSLEISGVATILKELMSSSASDKNKDTANDPKDKNDKKEPEVQLSEEEKQILQTASTFKPIISADTRLNAVVIRDVAIRMPIYETIIKQLDQQQLIVELSITTLDLTKDDSLDWQLSLKAAINRSHTQGAAAQSPDALTGVDALTGSGLAGAITYLGKNFDLAASLTALKNNHKARSIFRTTVLTLNNMDASVSDTNTFYAKVAGKEAVSFEEVTAGTTLQMRPRIVKGEKPGEEDLVWLTMKVSDGGFNSVTVDDMPMSNKSELTTQAAVFDTESIMLAGYMRDVKESAGWGIPYLRDIPFIGWLFGGLSTENETIQRMFILSPRILDIDQEMLARKQARQLRNIQDIEEMEEDIEEEDAEREIREEKIEHRREKREKKTKRTLKNLKEGYKREAEVEAAEEKAAEEAKEQAEQKAREDAEARAEAQKLAEKKAREEAEARAEAEEEARELAEKEAKAKAKAEEEARELAEKKAKEEAKARAKAEEEARELAEKKAREEAKARAKAEEEARKQAEQKAKAEAEAIEKAKKEQEAKDAELEASLFQRLFERRTSNKASKPASRTKRKGSSRND